MKQHYKKKFKKDLSRFNRELKKIQKRYKNNETVMLPEINELKFNDLQGLTNKEIKDLLNPMLNKRTRLVKLNDNSELQITGYELQKIKRDIYKYNKKINDINKLYENDTKYYKINQIDINEFKGLETKQDIKTFIKNYNFINDKSSSELVELNNIKIPKLLLKQIENKQNESFNLFYEKDLKNDKFHNKEESYVLNTSNRKKLEANLESLLDFENRDKRSMENFLKRLERFSFKTNEIKELRIYKENYLYVLEKMYGYKSSLFDKLKRPTKENLDYKNFYNKISKLSPEQFYEIIADDEIVSDIQQFYLNRDNLDEYFEKLVKEWDKRL